MVPSMLGLFSDLIWQNGDIKRAPLEDGGSMIWVLVTVIAVLTAFGCLFLLHRAFPVKVVQRGYLGEMQRTALSIIVVVLVVESVVILSILRADTKQYEALFGAVVGYVLGNVVMGRDSRRKREEEDPGQPGLDEGGAQPHAAPGVKTTAISPPPRGGLQGKVPGKNGHWAGLQVGPMANVARTPGEGEVGVPPGAAR